MDTNVNFWGVQAPSTATVMLSSDSSRENSPKRTAPSTQEEKDEKKADMKKQWQEYLPLSPEEKKQKLENYVKSLN